MTTGSADSSSILVGPHLDVRSVSAVRAALTAAQEAASGDVILDMAGLEVIDAAGLGLLAAAHVRAERSGQRLILRNCSKELRRVLAVTRLNRVLHVDRGSLELSA
jgi:anti-sigma B factor antagonist